MISLKLCMANARKLEAGFALNTQGSLAGRACKLLRELPVQTPTNIACTIRFQLGSGQLHVIADSGFPPDLQQPSDHS